MNEKYEFRNIFQRIYDKPGELYQKRLERLRIEELKRQMKHKELLLDTRNKQTNQLIKNSYLYLKPHKEHELEFIINGFGQIGRLVGNWFSETGWRFSFPYTDMEDDEFQRAISCWMLNDYKSIDNYIKFCNQTFFMSDGILQEKGFGHIYDFKENEFLLRVSPSRIEKAKELRDSWLKIYEKTLPKEEQ